MTKWIWGLTHQTGTNIGAALAEGINRLRPLESKSKILILLTDGKDEPPPPNSPLIYADGASKDGVKIYTIAIGTNSRTRTYLFDPSTRDLMRYTNGKPVVQVADYPVDKDILKKISFKTDALFFEAKDKKSSGYDVTQLNDQVEIHALALLLLEEAEHAVGHHVTTHDVDASERHGTNAQPHRHVFVTRTRQCDCTDHRNARDRISTRHEWGVQRRWHLIN